METLARGALFAAAGLYLGAMPFTHGQFYAVPIANLGVICLGAALALAHESYGAGPETVTTGLGPTRH